MISTVTHTVDILRTCPDYRYQEIILLNKTIAAFLYDLKCAKLKFSFSHKAMGEKHFVFHMKPKFLSSVHTAGHAESAKLLKIPQGINVT